jgi:hypothetical protein
MKHGSRPSPRSESTKEQRTQWRQVHWNGFKTSPAITELPGSGQSTGYSLNLGTEGPQKMAKKEITEKHEEDKSKNQVKFIKGLTEKRMKKFQKMHDEAELPKKENFKKRNAECWSCCSRCFVFLLVAVACFVLLCWWCSWPSLDLHHQ